ncbi:MAG: DUF177 domain-containing protein [Candidatus Latescibacteria bacterium]|nr:DUF177 domain-containing protein [Candidatus Latescibacterota bacterium]
MELKDEFFAFPSSVEARIEVRRALSNFKIDGVVTCRIAGECYRCLEEVQEGVTARFRLLVQRRQATPEELESAEKDGFIEIVDPGTREFDLRAYIREALILDLPMRIPTLDADDRCPYCGVDGAAEPTAEQEREADPRWAALAQIDFSQPKENS